MISLTIGQGDTTKIVSVDPLERTNAAASQSQLGTQQYKLKQLAKFTSTEFPSIANKLAFKNTISKKNYSILIVAESKRQEVTSRNPRRPPFME